MTSTPPPATDDDGNRVTARRAFRPVVRVGPSSAAVSQPLTDDDESDEFACTSVRLTAGGQVDQAVLSRRLGFTADRLDDSTTPQVVAGDREDLTEDLGDRRVEIWVEDPENPDETPVPIFVGVLRERRLALSRNDSEDVVATLEPDDFGGSVLGMRVWNPHGGEPEEEGDDPPGALALVEEDWVFNPTRPRTELMEGNMSSARPTIDSESFDDELDTDDEHPRLWLFPDSVRTTVGDTLHSDVSPNILWTIPHAVRTAQHELLEAYIDDETVDDGPNPLASVITPAYFDADLEPLEAVDENLFRNVLLPIGTRLPDVLDRLLKPLGCGWRVATESLGPAGAGAGETCHAVIRYFNTTNSAGAKTLRLPDVGESTDDVVGVVTDFRTNVSKAGATPRVRAVGQRQEREVTLELYRDWPVADDDIDTADITIDEDGIADGKTAVWRRFVANEAGDRTGERDEITAVPDLATVFGDAVPRRRSLTQPLTLRDTTEKTRLDFVLEWQPSEDDSWEPTPDGWGWTVLDDECGIQFTGQTPPLELIAQQSVVEEDEEADPPVKYAVYPRLRLTCTIHGDARLKSATGDSDSINAFQKVVPVPDRAADRSRVEGDEEANDDDKLQAHSRQTRDGVASRDDTDNIADIASDLSNRTKLARSGHRVTLSGIVTHLHVGDHIRNVRRRKVSMEIATDITPHIKTITYDFASQATQFELT